MIYIYMANDRTCDFNAAILPSQELLRLHPPAPGGSHWPHGSGGLPAQAEGDRQGQDCSGQRRQVPPGRLSGVPDERLGRDRQAAQRGLQNPAHCEPRPYEVISCSHDRLHTHTHTHTHSHTHTHAHTHTHTHTHTHSHTHTHAHTHTHTHRQPMVSLSLRPSSPFLHRHYLGRGWGRRGRG